MNTFEALMKRRTKTVHLPEIRPNEDPLRVVDALREAQVLDIWSECVTQTVGILLEMRASFVGGDDHASLIVGRGVRKFAWECSQAVTGDDSHGFGMAWNVASSVVEMRGVLLELDFDCIPNARLRIQSSAFEYYLAEVPGLTPAPPDYGEGPDDVVRANLPNWTRSIKLVRSSHRVAE